MRPGRSKTSLATYPHLQVDKKPLFTAEWYCHDGPQTVVKFEPLARNLSMKEKRAFQKNLLRFQPRAGSLAVKARGAYS